MNELNASSRIPASWLFPTGDLGKFQGSLIVSLRVIECSWNYSFETKQPKLILLINAWVSGSILITDYCRDSKRCMQKWKNWN